MRVQRLFILFISKAMETEYWTLINALLSFVEKGRVDAATLKQARLSLSVALDKCLACNLPTEGTKRLIGVLDSLYDKVSDNE